MNWVPPFMNPDSILLIFRCGSMLFHAMSSASNSLPIKLTHLLRSCLHFASRRFWTQILRLTLPLIDFSIGHRALVDMEVSEAYTQIDVPQDAVGVVRVIMIEVQAILNFTVSPTTRKLMEKCARRGTRYRQMRRLWATSIRLKTGRKSDADHRRSDCGPEKTL